MAPFTKAANKAIPARTIKAMSMEGIFSFSQLPASVHVARGIIAQRVTVSEGAHAVATRLCKGQGTALALRAVRAAGLRARFMLSWTPIACPCSSASHRRTHDNRLCPDLLAGL